MSYIKIGDIFSLKNHPYTTENTQIKISALAQMTPPLLVVTEILNSSNEYDTETGEKKSKQVKCIFYSHKTHKFETYWFNPDQLKAIKKKYEINGDSINLHEKSGEVNTKDEIDLNNLGIEAPKNESLFKLKKHYLNRQVILKSCDYELGKQKSTFEEKENKSSQKISAHLDFLPPVLTVIDVKKNEDKIAYNPKTGNQKKISSFFY